MNAPENETSLAYAMRGKKNRNAWKLKFARSHEGADKEQRAQRTRLIGIIEQEGSFVSDFAFYSFILSCTRAIKLLLLKVAP